MSKRQQYNHVRVTLTPTRPLPKTWTTPTYHLERYTILRNVRTVNVQLHGLRGSEKRTEATARYHTECCVAKGCRIKASLTSWPLSPDGEKGYPAIDADELDYVGQRMQTEQYLADVPLFRRVLRDKVRYPLVLVSNRRRVSLEFMSRTEQFSRLMFAVRQGKISMFPL